MDLPPNHQDAIDWLYRMITEEEPNAGNGHQSRVQDEHTLRGDDETIALCRKAKNSAKFAALFDDGDTSAYDGDDSAADQALVNILAFYTQDPDQLDRIFRRSALMRDKWERHTYRKLTIEAALKNLTETYTPPRDSRFSLSFSSIGKENRKSSGEESKRQRLRSQTFGEMGEPEPRRYAVEDLVPAAYPAMIYGDGGVAKSLLALSLGLAVARGAGSWLGRRVEAGGVFYLDYELDAPEQLRRVSQLARAEGIERIPDTLMYLSAVGFSAKDAFAAALEECQEHGPKLLIVDSLGPALEGDAEAARDVIAFYNSVIDPFRAVGVAVLVIDHQSKLQAGERYQAKRAFGSVFKSNLARSVMQVEATDRQDGELTVRIRQNKHNFGALLKPFGAKLTFTEKMIAVEHVELEAADLAEEATLTARERVRLVGEELPEGTPKEIHERVPDLALQTVRKALTELRKSGDVTETGEVRDREKVLRFSFSLPYREKEKEKQRKRRSVGNAGMTDDIEERQQDILNDLDEDGTA